MQGRNERATDSAATAQRCGSTTEDPGWTLSEGHLGTVYGGDRRGQTHYSFYGK